MKEQVIQLEYTANGSGYQLKIPMETEILIPKDDPVRLLNAICERIDYEELYAAYCEEGRPGYSPRILFKIISYGYMRQMYSSRRIEQACRENIKFMNLLEDHPAPDHNTIARFRKNRLGEAMEELLGQMVGMLEEAGEIELSTVYIDGTKIEAQATNVNSSGNEKGRPRVCLENWQAPGRPFFFLNAGEFESCVFPKTSKSGGFASPVRYFYFTLPDFVNAHLLFLISSILIDFCVHLFCQ